MVLLTKYAIKEMDVLPQSGGDDRLCQRKTRIRRKQINRYAHT